MASSSSSYLIPPSFPVSGSVCTDLLEGFLTQLFTTTAPSPLPFSSSLLSRSPSSSSYLFNLRLRHRRPTTIIWADYPDPSTGLLTLILMDHHHGPASAAGRKRRPPFSSPDDLLLWLRRAAVHPCDPALRPAELQHQILTAREALRMKISNPDHHPYQKKRRSTSMPSSKKQNAELDQEANVAMRRSKRCLEMLKVGGNQALRKRIPIGPEFQADVADWTGPVNQSNVLDGDERWFGIRLWTVKDEGREAVNEAKIGKGRLDFCSCPNSGSVACISSHVSAARLQLQHELGPAFTSMGFDEMGEDVLKSWTSEEELNFDTLVKQNPASEGKSFWDTAVTIFPKKSKKSIVSYYFNVFVPRRLCKQTRVLLPLKKIDSDDDESNCEGPESSYCTYSPRRFKCLRNKG